MEKQDRNFQDTVGFAQYDALRIECEDRIEKQRRELEEDKHKTVKGWQRICVFLAIIALMYTCGLFYMLYNYSFITVEQETTSGNANFVNDGGEITNGDPKN